MISIFFLSTRSVKSAFGHRTRDSTAEEEKKEKKKKRRKRNREKPIISRTQVGSNDSSVRRSPIRRRRRALHVCATRAHVQGAVRSLLSNSANLRRLPFLMSKLVTLRSASRVLEAELCLLWPKYLLGVMFVGRVSGFLWSPVPGSRAS